MASKIARDAADCAARLKVLADPTRLAVLELLMGGPRTVAQLNDVLAVEASLLSHHLRTLREARLVRARREGKGIRYELMPGVAAARRRALDLGCCELRFDAIEGSR